MKYFRLIWIGEIAVEVNNPQSYIPSVFKNKVFSVYFVIVIWEIPSISETEERNTWGSL